MNNENDENPLTSITDTLETLATGVPAPIRRNFWKAFSQLCTAAVDVPVAWLEGKRNTIRSTTEARNEIIKNSGSQISNNLNIPVEYSQKAGHIFASKIIRQQINLDNIVQGATIELINNTTNKDKEPEEISDDWLNEFEHYARLKSSEDMQFIFSKILANEINNPGKFKLKTLRTISQLTSEVAELFVQFCGTTINVYNEDKLAISFAPEFKKSATYKENFEKADLFYFDISILKEYGLVMTDDFSFNFKLIMEDPVYKSCTFIGENNFELIPKTEKAKKLGIAMSGNYLSDSGRELFSILKIDINPKFISNFVKHFDVRGIEVKFI